METYDIWADLLATFRASPDAIKALWLLIPPGMFLAVLALLLRYRLRRRETDKNTELTYTVIRQDDQTVQIYSHGTGNPHTDPIFLPVTRADSGKLLEYWERSEHS
ncbi:hypothetical protein FS827_20980 [Agrobacterium vitis]|uniref:hypothetical protein n=1 Tax=Allorhizobium ampelinum TaxID=3025782 RepID=UPI001F3613B4|nr:hypothetical protein [Allorhizobium ampelinum]MCF1463783.1 hypothetical protein [Allorhizobium ampelinum]